MMKLRIIACFLVLSTSLKGQVVVDTLYNIENGWNAFTHIYYSPTSDTISVISSNADDNAIDSNYFTHVILNKICITNGNITQIAIIQKNYWEIYTTYWVPFEPENNRFMFGMVDTAYREFSKYKLTYYNIVSTIDNWQTYSISKLNLPFYSYILSSCLKTSTGYIICGDTSHFVNSPAFIASFDLNFNLNWVITYPFQCRFTSVLKSGTGYFLSGVKDIDRNQRIFNMGIDSVGNILWQKNYLDTNYFISGFIGQGVSYKEKSYSYGFTTNDSSYIRRGYLNVLDLNGNLILEKFYTFNNNFVFRKIIEDNGSLYAIADLDSLVQTDTIGRLIHFSKISPETGKMEWYQIYKHWYGYNEIHNFYKIKDGFLMCGGSVNLNRMKEFDSTGIIESDAWLLKVDTNGCIIPGCKPNVYVGIQHILNDNNLIQVFPNPSTDYLNVSFKNQQLFNSANEIYIFDIAGNELFHQSYDQLLSLIKIQNTFNYSGFAFLVVKNVTGTYYKKIILR